MIVRYNGLELRLVRTLNFERQPVLSDDGNAYLFTKFTLNAVGIINCQPNPNIPTSGLGTSYRNVGIGIADVAEPNTNEVLTDIAIRHRFSIPRGKLTISTADGKLLLQSPVANLTSDCKDGPFPEAFSIKEVFGDVRLFMVHFQITTYVNECATEPYGTVSALLANRYSQNHEIDTDNFLKITTVGVAYFRTDALRFFNLNPDIFRPFLFLPIPVGFKRETIQVSAPSDGGRIDYVTVDVQKSDQYVLGQELGSTRIEVNYKESIISDPDMLGAVISALPLLEPTPTKPATGGFGSTAKEMKPRRRRMGTIKQLPKIGKP